MMPELGQRTSAGAERLSSAGMLQSLHGKRSMSPSACLLLPDHIQRPAGSGCEAEARGQFILPSDVVR